MTLQDSKLVAYTTMIAGRLKSIRIQTPQKFQIGIWPYEPCALEVNLYKNTENKINLYRNTDPTF